MSHTPRRAIAAAALLVIVSGCSKSEPAPVATPTPPAVAPTLAPTAAPPPPTPAPEPTAVPEPTAATVSGAEAKELVSPVALYPDPVLILVLQASTMPLQVVEADRFLQRYEQDTSLQPGAQWDSSVIGLLNYPAVIGMMSESLDWTQALGDAVLGNLGSVQTGVQELRWSAYNLGALRSNEYQDVVVDGREVRILPAKADAIALPQYDAGAMLAATESAPAAAAPAAAPAAAAPAAPAAAPAAPVAAAPAAAPVAAAPVAAAPTVVYAEPQSSFWSDAAIFAGGAAVGGLLGYAIFGDDDDDDWHGGYNQPDWSRDINIEDSNIVIGDRYDRDRVEQQLRDRADRPANRPAARPNRPVPASAAGRPAQRPVPVGARPGAGAPAARPVQLPKPVKPVAVPKPAKPAGARPASAAAPAAKVAKRPGDARPAPKAGLGDVRPAPQVKKESQRGQTSRAAQQKVAARPAAPARQPAPKVARPAAAPQRGGGLSPPRGGNVSRDANRGKQSRGGGGGGRGGGGRGKR